MKKMMSMLCVLVMTLMMTLPALAANGFSITITNTSAQLTMVGNTYKAYKVFDVTYNDDKSAYSYTVADVFKNFTYTVGQDNYTGESLIEYVGKLSANSDALNQFAAAVQDYIADQSISAAGQATATQADTVTIDLTVAGYYIVTATASTTDANETVTALCALTTAAPNTSINLKADAPTIEKTVKENNGYVGVTDCAIGDTVEFQLVGTIPNYASKYTNYTYIIHDDMEQGLTLDATSIKVYSNVALTQEVASNGYTVTTSGLGDTCDFEVSFADAWIKANGNTKVYIVYSAILNEKASIEDLDGNTNKARIEYSNNPYDTSSTDKTPDTEARVYTFSMGVLKYRMENTTETALAGAQFKLFSDEQCTTEIKLVAGANGYRVAQNGETAVEYVESDVTGNITIEGLDAATYYLKETKAPNGYNLLEAPIKVEILAEKNATGTAVDKTTLKQDNIEVEKIKVLNQSGSLLPSTGGIGTTIFYLIGGLMMFGAAVLLVTRRRMGNRE